MGALHANLQISHTAASHLRLCMVAVSRERLTPTGADTPICLRATDANFHPHVIHQNARGCTAHVMARRPSYPEGVHRVPLILHVRRSQIGLEVDGHLRWRKLNFSLLPAFWNAEEQAP